MKRVLTLILSFALCLLLAMSAFADVIYEPEDSFYEKHRDECHYENRVYIAAGEEGHAAVMKDPKSSKVVEELPNGTEFWVSYVWDQDGGWALMDRHGWVSMSELTVKYDGVSFEEEYGSEFVYLDEWEFVDFTGCDCLQLWRYPGDAAPYACLSWTGENAWFSEAPDDLSVNTIYESPSGERWGHIHYYYGYRDCWVNLSDPAGAPLPEPGQGEAEPTPSPGETSAPAPTAAPATASPAPTDLPPIIDPEPPRSFPWLPAGLAGGAVVIAGALLALFRKKK